MESAAVRDTVANGVSVEINDAVLLRILVAVCVAVASTDGLTLGVSILCVRCVIVCVTLEDVLPDNGAVGEMLYDTDAVTVIVYVNTWDTDIAAVTEAFDVDDIDALVLEDTVGDIALEEDSVEEWLDVTDILGNPLVVTKEEGD